MEEVAEERHCPFALTKTSQVICIVSGGSLASSPRCLGS